MKHQDKIKSLLSKKPKELLEMEKEYKKTKALSLFKLASGDAKALTELRLARVGIARIKTMLRILEEKTNQ